VSLCTIILSQCSVVRFRHGSAYRHSCADMYEHVAGHMLPIHVKSSCSAWPGTALPDVLARSSAALKNRPPAPISTSPSKRLAFSAMLPDATSYTNKSKTRLAPEGWKRQLGDLPERGPLLIKRSSVISDTSPLGWGAARGARDSCGAHGVGAY
jgi:hypothetical protein